MEKLLFHHPEYFTTYVVKMEHIVTTILAICVHSAKRGLEI
jgi:hypothetical protein